MPGRRLLLAGSWGPERLPARPDPESSDWFLPLHLRDELGARERIAAQVAAGADVVVAPTWLTHRRALLPLGETRRAGAWTAAAVRVARQAVEMGLERREELLAEIAGLDPRRGRPAPLVAASLPALDHDPEPGTGRLLPSEAASERDYRDQAGLLADAEPDLLLVEGQRAEAIARIALGEAVDTGLRVWAAPTSEVLLAAGEEACPEWAPATGLERLLLPSSSDPQIGADSQLPCGVVTPALDDIPEWLEAGADVVARLDGASVATLDPVRAAIDDYERVEIEAARMTERRWLSHVDRAAAMAPGGAAAWIGPRADAPLPDGYEWLAVEPAEARLLPAAHYRLVIAAEEATVDLGRLLDRGGVLASSSGGAGPGDVELRLLVLDDSAAPVLRIQRREP